jgi:pseudaminic acid synthase
MRDIKIGKKFIGSKHEPFIIAEMSANHNHSLERALTIVDAAADCGVHAIKLQTYTADTITINHTGGLFSINDSDSLWNGRNLYDLYQEAYTPWEWHEAIFNRAKERGMLAFSTPFDDTSVDFLETLNVPCYKIASFENNHLPLLKKVASTGKPVIISTGLSSISILEDAVKTLRDSGCHDIILLKCTSAYPALPESSNLRTIPHMSELFKCHVGLSDHTMGIGVAIASIVLGARVIEKHFTLDRKEGGVDSAFSMEPHEMKLLVDESERAFKSLGQVQYGIQESERNSILFKRSVDVVQDIEAGGAFTKENIRIIRPGDGLLPKYFEIILGKKAKTALKKGEPITWAKLV